MEWWLAELLPGLVIMTAVGFCIVAAAVIVVCWPVVKDELEEDNVSNR